MQTDPAHNRIEPGDRRSADRAKTVCPAREYARSERLAGPQRSPGRGVQMGSLYRGHLEERDRLFAHSRRGVSARCGLLSNGKIGLVPWSPPNGSRRCRSKGPTLIGSSPASAWWWW